MASLAPNATPRLPRKQQQRNQQRQRPLRPHAPLSVYRPQVQRQTVLDLFGHQIKREAGLTLMGDQTIMSHNGRTWYGIVRAAHLWTLTIRTKVHCTGTLSKCAEVLRRLEAHQWDRRLDTPAEHRPAYQPPGRIRIANIDMGSEEYDDWG